MSKIFRCHLISITFALSQKKAYKKTMKVILKVLVICFVSSALWASTALEHYQKLQQKYKIPTSKTLLIVDINTQKITGFKNKQLLFSYPVSTASKGSGQKAGSYQTPLGLHRIQRKIGQGAARGMIFKGRVATGETFDPNTHDPEGDWVTSRILHLKGLEKGLNAGPGIDSYRRLIYIHGTPFEDKIATPSSKGCIRMKNLDVIRLFEKVKKGDWVLIVET